MSTVPNCPDCHQVIEDDGTVTHSETCPNQSALDAVSDRDRVWFERHPQANVYYRPAEPGDYGVANLGRIQVQGRVKVTWLADGLRSRHMPPIAFPLAALTLNEQFVADLMEAAGKLRPEEYDRITRGGTR